MQTVEQRSAALVRANEIRSAAAEVKRRVKALPRPEGFAAVIELLDKPETATGSLQIDALLKSIKREGPRKVSGLLHRASIFGCRQRARVDVLTVAERSRISTVLSRKADL